MKRFKIRVCGRVQGVFFRYNTKKVADKLKLNGYVRNNPNGIVEIVAEGSDEKINKLIEWCKKGPIGSKVEKVEIKEEKYKKEFENFSIVY
jgi:acylphosphatase